MWNRIAIWMSWSALMTCLLMWVISYRQVCYSAPNLKMSVRWYDGALALDFYNTDIFAMPAGFYDRLFLYDMVDNRWLPSYNYCAMPPIWELRILFIPFYIPTALFAALTYYVCPFFLRRDRRSRGLCGYCAYDIRGSKQRCPECGAQVPATSLKPALES